uniref:Uncharacterized protein n=1 Tax=Arundo donax TaxID=35708 RepID=A0A0A8Y1J1_ARUDO
MIQNKRLGTDLRSIINDICRWSIIRSSQKLSKNFRAKLDLSILQSAIECSFSKSHSLNPSTCVFWT